MSQNIESPDRETLQNRPGILIVGSPNVGKRTLLSRLLSVDNEEDSSASPSQVLANGWSINTKYYTADVSIWTAHLHDGFSLTALPVYDRLAALVMVFDMSDLSSLSALKDWVSRNDVGRFEILLCIGNKADRIPGHPMHVEYRRRLQRRCGEGFTGPEFGISESEGSSLLDDREEEETSQEIKRACIEWCSEHGIEYIEACASNADFDKCLSVEGDSQGVERLYGALSAYMWPGMILKSGNKITGPSLPDKEELSEEESEYELEYEVLSGGSAEPWDDAYGGWVSGNDLNANPEGSSSSTQNNVIMEHDDKIQEHPDKRELPPSPSPMKDMQDDKGVEPDVEEFEKTTEPAEAAPFDFEDLEQLMSEIGNVRNSLRFLPDFQRREMAAKLAMKMAAMFGGGSDDEEDIN